MLYKSEKKFLEIQEGLIKKISGLVRKPFLAVLVVGDDSAMRSFVSIKKKFAQRVGVDFIVYEFDTKVSTQTLIEKIKSISTDNVTTSIIVQLPLPKSIDTEKVLSSIPKHLDADVLSEGSYRDFKQGDFLMPPVARAVLTVLDDTATDLINKSIVVVGMGKLVGIPVCDSLYKKGLNVKTIDIDTSSIDRLDILKNADIIISGTGSPSSITEYDIKEGVVLIDAGTSEQAGRLMGDIDPGCLSKASIITATPGGVGPLTVACLFQNVVELTYRIVK
jgi:methylenetetrahydrofolate dehydrogenase (NADP+)/methenyltetrahydrofolate cyclohydrolase